MKLNSKNWDNRIKLTSSIPTILFLILFVLGIFSPFVFIFAIIALSVNMIINLAKNIKKIQSKAKEQAFNLNNEEEEEEEKELDEKTYFWRKNSLETIHMKMMTQSEMMISSRMTTE